MSTIDKIKEKVDHVLHPDHKSTTHHTGGGAHSGATTATGHNPNSTNAGPHDTNLGNKLDPRVDSDRDHSSNMGATNYGHGPNTTTTNEGPHNSNLANKMDPRVDSDRDRSTNMGMANYGPGGAMSNNTGPASRTAGPHSSNIANKLDPRVDSDADGSGNAGFRGSGPNSNLGGSTNAGPHSSNIANKMDPRVDSDLDGSRTAGGNYNAGSNTGFTGTGPNSNVGGSTNAGPHNSNLANKLDPRVDSDLDGSRTAGGNYNSGSTGIGSNTGYSGTGGSTNAGPHNSNLANKLDPRVDSDLDGSRTAGGNPNTTSTY